MAEKVIDIALESTSQEILNKVNTDIPSIWSNPVMSAELTENYGNVNSCGPVGSTEGSVVITYKDNLYVIPDNERKIYRCSKTVYCWDSLDILPYSIDVHETTVIVYNDEIHFLGGRGMKSRTHFKWDGERFEACPELPYDFCNGTAIVFRDELHIIGGGTGNYTSEYQSGYLNNHYKWENDSTWVKVSDLPYITWGATPFVCNDKLHLVGGTTLSESGTTLYNRKVHYMWDGISWSGGIDFNLGDGFYYGSIAKKSDNEIYLMGGIADNGEKTSKVYLYSNGTWSDTGYELPKYGKNNTRRAADVYNGNVVTHGYFLYTLGLNGWGLGYQNTLIEPGHDVLYIDDPESGLPKGIHVFSNKTHKYWDGEWHRISNKLRYEFRNGSAVFFDHKIHLIGGATDPRNHIIYEHNGEEWKWTTGPNLNSIRFKNGCAIVHNNEIHIIGGSLCDFGAYNHYKLKGNKWVPVSYIPTEYEIRGSKCCVEIDGILYCINSALRIFRFNDKSCSWQSCNNSLHGIDEYNSDTGYADLVNYKGQLFIYVHDTLYDYNTNTEDRVRVLMVSDINNIKPKREVIGVFMFIMVSPAHVVPVSNNVSAYNVAVTEVGCEHNTLHSTNGYFPSPNGCNKGTIKLYITEGHTFVCDKTYYIPLYGQVEPVSNGYKALDSGLYIFGKHDPNSTNTSDNPISKDSIAVI